MLTKKRTPTSGTDKRGTKNRRRNRSRRMGGLITVSCLAAILVWSQIGSGNGRFKNLDPYEKPGFGDFLKWRWERAWQENPDPDSYDFPLAANDLDFLRENRTENTLTWIGHATVLLQIDGMNILTDPHFSERASPVQWAGPRRIVEPGIALEDLPPIDAVVISHDHYDALDKGSILALRNRPGGEETLFCVPLGFGEWLQKRSVERVIELNWWESHREGLINFTAVPVQHWSKRTPFSTNETLWSGWAIQSEEFSFLFTGDSGYTPRFREIGERLGPFDLAAIPIGAYEPRWFMKAHHLNPADAVQVHKDLRARKSVAIHWGTFILTDEPLDEPPLRLAVAREEAEVPAEDFVVLMHGETIRADKKTSDAD